MIARCLLTSLKLRAAMLTPSTEIWLGFVVRPPVPFGPVLISLPRTLFVSMISVVRNNA